MMIQLCVNIIFFFFLFQKDDLINFEKRRKEFEIVAQIKLLQQSAKNYHLSADQQFCVWFNSLRTYGDKDG